MVWTADLLSRKQLLCQLCYNHCPFDDQPFCTSCQNWQNLNLGFPVRFPGKGYWLGSPWELQKRVSDSATTSYPTGWSWTRTGSLSRTDPKKVESGWLDFSKAPSTSDGRALHREVSRTRPCKKFGLHRVMDGCKVKHILMKPVKVLTVLEHFFVLLACH